MNCQGRVLDLGNYCIDAYAWVEYLIGSEKGKKVADIVENPDNMIFTSPVTLAEVVSVVKRESRDCNAAFSTILNLSKLFEISGEVAMETGRLHAEIKKRIRDFGLADAFVLLAAKKLTARVVTGDPHFKGFSEALML